MRLKLILFLIVSLAYNAFSYNTIEGTINSGTWESGTYYINETARLNKDSVLYINAGVVVKFAAETYMNIYGKLYINGASGNEVVFTSMNDDEFGEVIGGSSGSPQPGDYYYVGMNGHAGEGECNAEWTIFKYGGKQYSNLNYSYNATGLVKNCQFEYSNANGLRLYQSEVSIENCDFRYNGKNGLSAWYYSTPHIKNNTFYDNVNYAIYLSSVHVTSPYTGNTASNNNIDGIVIRGNDAFDTNNSSTLYNSGLMPYVIEGNTPIYQTLTIEAGTILKFMDGAYIYTGAAGGGLHGTIIVNGTEEEPVIFTSINNDSVGGDTNNNSDSTLAMPGDWECISIINGRGEFNWCKMSYGGETDKTLHFWNGGNGFFKNGEVVHSAKKGVYTNSQNFELSDSKIQFNGLEGIYLTGNSSKPKILNNIISDNGGRGITAYGSIPLISNNRINNNNGEAVYFQSTLFKYPFNGNSATGNQTNGFVIGALSTDSSSTLYESGETMPYVIRGNLVTYGTLTINEGSVLKFENDRSYIYTVHYLENSKVIAHGTAENPIIFTSFKDDDYCGDTNTDGDSTLAAPGDWQYLSIADNSVGEFEHCLFRYGGASSQPVIKFGENTKGYVKNSIIKNNAHSGIYTENNIAIVNNEIRDNGDNGLTLDQSSHDIEPALQISGNTISNNDRLGISCYYYSKIVLRDNVIENNSGNGIRIGQHCQIDLGGVENETAADGGKNLFSGNDNNGYQIYSMCSDSIRAYNNYWDWNNADSIDAHIYDDDEDSGNGIVFFSPWMEELSADFSANTTSGPAPLTVTFTDQSGGSNINSWKWDFENDGTFDSNEQNPEFTYSIADTYNVKLVISDGSKQDSLIKTAYIKVQTGTSINDDSGLLPTVTQLWQNYPNPFNPVTQIKFGLPKASSVKLTIYNALGQKVATLLNTHKPAGCHEVTFSAGQHASGVYYYRIDTGEFVQVRKMLLVK